jgi:hypothetical protein
MFFSFKFVPIDNIVKTSEKKSSCCYSFFGNPTMNKPILSFLILWLIKYDSTSVMNNHINLMSHQRNYVSLTLQPCESPNKPNKFNLQNFPIYHVFKFPLIYLPNFTYSSYPMATNSNYIPYHIFNFQPHVMHTHYVYKGLNHDLFII